MKEPDFLIVGAMKAGTTTLADLLNQSPDIYLPEDEVHYFDRDFDKPFEKYLNNFPSEENLVVGEKTPTYSYDLKVPKRIHDALPDVKLIWILRNPVDRAYSNYWHAFKKGAERSSFEDAVNNDLERYKNDFFKAYLSRSRYVDQVERYLKYFTRKQMYFLLFENLKKNEQEEMDRLADFLDVSRFEVKQLPKSNKTYLPRSSRVEYYANKLFHRSIIWKIIHHLNKKSTPGYPSLSKELRNQLIEEFAASNHKLSKITGLNLQVWKD